MGISAEQYLNQLQALLPLGAAWPRDAESTLTKLLHAFADELARVDGRAAALIDEADPRTTSEMLADWERVAGLPDSCVAVEQSTAQRIAALVTKLTTIGGQSRAYYIALAATLGYAITITEFNEHSVDDDVDALLYSAAWQFAWQVNAPLNTIFELSVDDSVDDPLASWGNEALECVINRLKPAHTHVLFAYA